MTDNQRVLHDGARAPGSSPIVAKGKHSGKTSATRRSRLEEANWGTTAMLGTAIWGTCGFNGSTVVWGAKTSQAFTAIWGTSASTGLDVIGIRGEK